MSSVSYDPAREIKLYFRIGRRQTKRFIFYEDGEPFDIVGITWTLFIKEYPGARTNAINLTLGNGLSISIYDDNILQSDFSVANTKIREGEYYFELLRSDIPETIINGYAIFSYGVLDAENSGDIEININT